MEGLIRVKPWGDGQGDFVLIEAKDFDKEKHELFEPDNQDDSPKRKPRSK